jgi:hypothetical protein
MRKGSKRAPRTRTPICESAAPVPFRRLRPQLERLEMLAEGGQCPFSLERQWPAGLMQRGAILAEHGDVLAQPSTPAPTSRTYVVMRSNS